MNLTLFAMGRKAASLSARSNGSRIELAGISAGGQRIVCFLRCGHQCRRIDLADINLADFGQRARRAAWRSAAARAPRRFPGLRPLNHPSKQPA
jgi:hypothetical protein